MSFKNIAVFSVLSVVTLLAPAAGRAQEARSPQARAALAEAKKMLGVDLALLTEMPDEALPAFWEQLKTLQLNPNTALSGRTKELIGLGVSAQVPCRYCVYGHREFAKLNGASERELREAAASAGVAREMSALTNGQSPDSKYEGMKAPAEAAATYKEIEKVFGSVPEFLRRYPAGSIASLWSKFKAIQLTAGAISVKDKALIALAVAAQTPSAVCVKDYTGLAKANGATDQEVQEALAMAGITRSASTVLNASLTDEAAWRRNIDQLVKNVKSASAKTASAK